MKYCEVNKAEYRVHLVSTNRLREFCGVHSWNMNGTRCRDGVKVLSFPSSLGFFFSSRSASDKYTRNIEKTGS